MLEVLNLHLKPGDFAHQAVECEVHLVELGIRRVVCRLDPLEAGNDVPVEGGEDRRVEGPREDALEGRRDRLRHQTARVAVDSTHDGTAERSARTPQSLQDLLHWSFHGFPSGWAGELCRRVEKPTGLRAESGR